MNSPFDKAKYDALLKGLEVSEVLLSEILKDIFRLDSEPFQKINKINCSKFEMVKLSAIAFTNPVKSEISKIDKNLPVSFIPMTMLGNGIINEKEDGKISDFTKSGYTYFAENDILVAKITPCMEHGKCAIAKKLKNGIGFGSTEYNVFRVKDNRILTEYLFAYLNRNVIRKQAENNMIGTSGRQRVPIAFYENLDIPIIDYEIQKKIKNFIDNSYTNREQSQALYREAEALLLESIGVADFKPDSENVNIKTFSQSFGATGRLDAEYYQKKYEAIIALVKTKAYELLKDLVAIKKSIEPGSDVYADEGLPFIRVSDYGKFGISTPDKYLSDKYVKENEKTLKSLFPKKETILFSKDGSVGTAYMAREDMRAVTSGAILHLTVKDKTRVLPEYLTLVLNSCVVKQQAERDAGGSIILHWRIAEIENVVIPIAPRSTQERIAGLIQKSFALRQSSESLLKEAKLQVEREIEKI